LEQIIPYLKALILVPVTLLPIINPLSTAPVFVASAGRNKSVAPKLARQVAINCWFVLVVAMLIGTYVLSLFGISLPIVRLGGGLLVAAVGWGMLNKADEDDIHAAAAEETVDLPEDKILKRSFFPITFPLTTGPGTIAASIALGTEIPRTPALYFAGAIVAGLGAAVTAVAIYLCFRYAAALLGRLGVVGTMVMIRLSGFLLLCIGLQIMWTGWAELNHL
jgi:multiple antibiotic resistance protein